MDKRIQEIKQELKRMSHMSCDPEADHCRADDLLCEVIAILLFDVYDGEEIVEYFNKIEKWYS